MAGTHACVCEYSALPGPMLAPFSLPLSCQEIFSQLPNIDKSAVMMPWRCFGGEDRMAAAMALQDGRRIVGASCYYLDWNWKWREHFERDVAHLMPTSRPSRRDMALLTGGEGQCIAVACIPA